MTSLSSVCSLIPCPLSGWPVKPSQDRQGSDHTELGIWRAPWSTKFASPLCKKQNPRRKACREKQNKTKSFFLTLLCISQAGVNTSVRIKEHWIGTFLWAHSSFSRPLKNKSQHVLFSFYFCHMLDRGFSDIPIFWVEDAPCEWFDKTPCTIACTVLTQLKPL